MNCKMNGNETSTNIFNAHYCSNEAKRRGQNQCKIESNIVLGKIINVRKGKLESISRYN